MFLRTIYTVVCDKFVFVSFLSLNKYLRNSSTKRKGLFFVTEFCFRAYGEAAHVLTAVVEQKCSFMGRKKSGRKWLECCYPLLSHSPITNSSPTSPHLLKLMSLSNSATARDRRIASSFILITTYSYGLNFWVTFKFTGGTSNPHLMLLEG